MSNRIFNRKLLCTLCAIVIWISCCAGCSEVEYITGNEWLIVQKQCLTDLDAYTSGMDEVFSLYLVGGMEKNDFLQEIRVLKQQYAILKEFRVKLKADNPVKEGSHSYVSKRGTEALDNYYDTLGEILDYAIDETGQPLPTNEMSYGYLAYKQSLTSSLSEYVTAVVWYEETKSS